MNLLGLDIGSSSVKAGVLRDGKVVGRIARGSFETRYDGTRAEVDAGDVLKAIQSATRQLSGTRSVDAIAFATMSPSWLAMDKCGRPITPIVTHQDRRSVEIANDLLARAGAKTLLRVTGNLPFPGGISSTTFAWFLRHQRALMRRADLVGNLDTFLHRLLTGERVTDPSNASFTGLLQTITLRGWSDEMCDVVGVRQSLLPEVQGSNEIAGHVTRDAARRFDLKQGTPVLVGCMDGSAAMLLAGAEPGQLLNVTGSTDVLALCTDRPRPNERLLTRALGVGRRWLQVGTIAAAGSSLVWAKERFFADLSDAKFRRLLSQLAKDRRAPSSGASAVRFAPYLAGERTSIDQRQAMFAGLTLATTREDMLAAIIDALAKASAARIPLLQKTGTRLRRRVVVSGGVSDSLHQILRKDWPGRWTFKQEDEATLRGLGVLASETNVAG
jgi:xylulokinase